MPMIPPEIILQVEKFISGQQKFAAAVSCTSPVGGGCINRAFCLEAGETKYFLKWNDAGKYPGMFEAEAKGLKLLRDAGVIKIPRVFRTETAGTYSFILMEWIEQGSRKSSFWNDFGKSLAHLHSHTQEQFGLDHDNYIGSLSQSNRQCGSWIEFFMHERIEPQWKLAVNTGKLADLPIGQLANLERILPEIIPDEKPALLHGDLWNGNFLVDTEGAACLIDPAVYYGHREMDLAMTKLFGGFDPEFYRSYQAEFPLEKGFESRLDIHNLYPLLVHVNLFGGGYVQQVKNILSRF